MAASKTPNVMSKKYTHAGICKNGNTYKTCFTNDTILLIKKAWKGNEYPAFVELPEPMDKCQATAFLKNSELYATAEYAEAIDHSNDRYNVVKVSTGKRGRPSGSKNKTKAKEQPNLADIIARVATEKTEVVAE